MSVAIKAENLCKKYKIYKNEKHRIMGGLGKKHYTEFYALKDVSFEINKGECVGIIGHNGAGKSTLLKILTGVAFPNGGKLTVNGKVSSLLELGSGFNPEFNGIENIYFNGGLNGLTDEQIEAAIPEIIKFADIGDFIYQPVKSYSSGMFARLAFATAINIDPDILIVDEILSVGDVKFQVKCMEKFKEFKEKGKTILYVSHGLGTVKKFCDRAIWLEHGQIKDDGSSVIVVEKYYNTNFVNYDVLDKEEISFDKIISSKLICENKEIKYNEEVKFRYEYNLKEKLVDNIDITFEIRKINGRNSEFVTDFSSRNIKEKLEFNEGMNSLIFKINKLNMMSGSYYINVIYTKGKSEIYRQRNVFGFVVDDKYRGEGFIIPEHTWSK